MGRFSVKKFRKLLFIIRYKVKCSSFNLKMFQSIGNKVDAKLK